MYEHETSAHDIESSFSPIEREETTFLKRELKPQQTHTLEREKEKREEPRVVGEIPTTSI
jgi:hypothetical protein